MVKLVKRKSREKEKGRGGDKWKVKGKFKEAWDWIEIILLEITKEVKEKRLKT